MTQTNTCPVLVDPASGTRHALPEGVTRIGRSQANDVVLDQPWISREHCLLVRLGSTVRVHDRSEGKTRIDGAPVEDGQVLADEQTLSLGKLDLRIERSAPSHAHAAWRRDAWRASAALAASALLALTGVLSSGTSVPDAAPAPVVAKTAPAPAVAAPAKESPAPPMMASLDFSGMAVTPEEPPTRLNVTVEPLAPAATKTVVDPKTAVALERTRRLASQLHRQLTRTREDLAGARRERDKAISDRKLLEQIALKPRALSTAEEVEDNESAEAPPADGPDLPSLGKARIAALLKELKETIDDHASPLVRADDLNVGLVALTNAAGPEPARALLEVHRYALTLIEAGGKKLTLAKRNHRELKTKLEKKMSKKAKEQGPRRQNVGKGTNEVRQRELEVLAKIVELRAAQLERLRALDARLVEAVLHLAAPEAVEVVSVELTAQAKRVRSKRDAQLVAAILRRLASATWGRRKAASALLDHLSIKDRRLRAEVRDALLELCSNPTKTKEG